MPTELRWTPTDTGIEFTAKNTDSDAPLHVSEWDTCEDLQSSQGRKVNAGSLLFLLEEEQAKELDAGTLQVPWLYLVQLPQHNLTALGLPPVADLALELSPSGAFNEKDFYLKHWYVKNGRRREKQSYDRQGALLTDSSGQQQLLPYPLYPLVDKIERCSRANANFQEVQMMWGEISEELPDETRVDLSLRTRRVYVPSKLSIIPFSNSDGEADFVPELGTSSPIDNPVEDRKDFKALLPPIKQDEFYDRWHRLSSKKTYTLSNGTVVFINDPMHAVLSRLKHIHDGPVAGRKALLHNPHGVLRSVFDENDPLGSSLEELVHLDHLSYSERVEATGPWQSKVIPWIQLETNEWIPDAEPKAIGVTIAGLGPVTIKPQDLPGLIKKVDSAVKKGAPYVTYDGMKLPANNSTQKALRSIKAIGSRLPKKPTPTSSSVDEVLLVLDNLGNVKYSSGSTERKALQAGPPNQLKSELLPHQRKALSWLQDHYHAGTPGALLADDMGLGKTLVALSFLLWLKQGMSDGHLSRKPVLIVGPVGLLHNWREEHERHVKLPGLGILPLEAFGVGLKSLRLHGRKAEPELQTGAPSLDTAALKRADWVTTSYETLRDYQHSFGLIKWAAIIFDEVQKIKNPAVKLTEAALAMNADFVVTMTGTPVENRVADIWTIIDRAQPGRLGSLKEFSQRYESPKGAENNASLRDLNRELTEESQPPIMLRRLKRDHLKGLPKKHEYPTRVSMPVEQAAEYRRVAEQGATNPNKLTALKEIRDKSLHPFINYDQKEPEKYVQQSARLKGLVGILDNIKIKDEKALIFIEQRWMQEFLRTELRRRYALSEPVLVINGAVTAKNRQVRVNAFQQRHGFDVMLLSPRAGGVGITLTAANHVIHLSRWWNPAVEDQCTDRVYRIGQEKDVHVHYLMAQHPNLQASFDLTLDALLTRKRELSQKLLAPTASHTSDIDELYRKTFEENLPTHSFDFQAIDVRDGYQFENWVVEQFSEAGYTVHATGQSGDGGADVIADDPNSENRLLIQCKHVGDPESVCGPEGVREIVKAKSRFSESSAGGDSNIALMLVTNASSFSNRAVHEAQENSVELVGRDKLPGLRTRSVGISFD